MKKIIKTILVAIMVASTVTTFFAFKMHHSVTTMYYLSDSATGEDDWKIADNWNSSTPNDGCSGESTPCRIDLTNQGVDIEQFLEEHTEKEDLEGLLFVQWRN